MTTPITHPAPAEGLRTTADYAQAFWLVKEQGDEEAGELLLKGFLAWKFEQQKPDSPVWPYLVDVCAERLDEPGNLLNTYWRALARATGYTGNLTELQTWGRALAGTKFVRAMTPAQIARTEHEWLIRFGRQWLNVPDGEAHPLDTISESEITEALIGMGLSPLEVRQARLSALEAALRVQKRETAEPLSLDRERSYELLKARAPDASRGSVEAERLAHQTLQEVARVAPQIFDGAVKRVQAGEPDGRKLPGSTDTSAHFTEDAFKPMRRSDFLKLRGEDFVTGKRPKDGRVNDLHHVPLGNHDARRNDGGQEVMVAAIRERHVPVPGGPITAHHSDYSPGFNPDKLLFLIWYDTRQSARYERFIRNEPDLPALDTWPKPGEV